MLIKDPPVQVTSHLWMLGTNAFPLYFYQGEQEGTLFEGTISAMGPLVGEQLRGLGVAPDTVRQAVVTHAHPDHVMGIPLFRELFPGVSVIASESATKTLQIDKAVSFFCKMDGALTDWLIGSGRMVEASRQAPRTETQIVVDRTVREGDQIEVSPGVSFRVLETPGHSHCSLSFHEPHENILIISDATGYYMPDQDFMWPGYLTSYNDYLRSIERLAEIGAETLCLSHNAVIRGVEEVAAYFRRAVAATEQYHQRIVAKAKAGAPVPEIAGELGSDIYARTGQLSLDFFQKNCALLVKNSLRHEGIDS
ncbi:MAG: MBL fold metallo-hydrolase [Pirellulaceae bacterium]